MDTDEITEYVNILVKRYPEFVFDLSKLDALSRNYHSLTLVDILYNILVTTHKLHQLHYYIAQYELQRGSAIFLNHITYKGRSIINYLADQQRAQLISQFS